MREADEEGELPASTRQALQALVAQLAALQDQIGRLERSIHAQRRASEASQRLETIPNVGVIGATAIAATVTDPRAFKSGRELAAWIGLVPRQNSTGSKQKLGGISKQGDKYLRRLLIVGATAVIRHARAHPEKRSGLTKLLAKMPAKKIAVALAKQDGPHRLGDFGQGRHIPATSARSCSLKRRGDWSMRQRQRTNRFARVMMA